MTDQVVTSSGGLDQGLGSGRNPKLERLPILSVAERPLTVSPPAGLEARGASEGSQVAQRAVTHQDYVAAPAPVATIRPAAGHVSLAAEAQAAVTAAPSLDVDSCSVLH